MRTSYLRTDELLPQAGERGGSLHPPLPSSASSRPRDNASRSCSLVIASTSRDRGASGSATLNGMLPVSETAR